ncbi:MAG: hypothetical protein ACOVQX_05265 [Legionella sp.]
MDKKIKINFITEDELNSFYHSNVNSVFEPTKRMIINHVLNTIQQKFSHQFSQYINRFHHALNEYNQCSDDQAMLALGKMQAELREFKEYYTQKIQEILNKTVITSVDIQPVLVEFEKKISNIVQERQNKISEAYHTLQNRERELFKQYNDILIFKSKTSDASIIPNDILRHIKSQQSNLAREIYQYLTGNINAELNYKELAKEPIFASSLGKKYKNLIESLVHTSLDQRIHINQAYRKLQELECQATLAEKLNSFQTSGEHNQIDSDLETNLDRIISKMNKTLLEKFDHPCHFLRQAFLRQIKEEINHSKSDRDIVLCLDTFDQTLQRLETTLSKAQELDSINARFMENRSYQSPIKESNIVKTFATELNAAIQNSEHLSDLNHQLDQFSTKLLSKENTLQQELSISEKFAEYREQRNRLISLAHKETSNEMEYFLYSCDQHLMKGTNRIELLESMNSTINRMTTLVDTLESRSGQYALAKQILKSSRLGVNDKEMNKFLLDCEKKIIQNASKETNTKASTSLATDQIINEMNQIGSKLASKEYTDFTRLLNQLGYTKAETIKQLFSAIPVEERLNLLESKHPAVSKFIKKVDSYKELTTQTITFFKNLKNQNQEIKKINQSNDHDASTTKIPNGRP